MKKNIFISVALIVLAVLAGCAQQSPYPHVPSSAKIRQVGDFVVGQSFDPSKFEVDVTYLDRTTETLKNAALTISGDGADASNIKGGEKISITVGNDINGQPVKGEGTIGRVYSVSYIEATTAETTFALSENAEEVTDTSYVYWPVLAPQTFSVTAYYNGGQKIAVDAADYAVIIAVDTNQEGYDEATEVAGTAIVVFNADLSEITGADDLAGLKFDTVDVTVSKTAEATGTGEVKSINGLSNNQSFAFAALKYDEISAEEIAESIKMVVTLDDGTAAGQSGQYATVASLGDAVTYKLVDSKTGSDFSADWNSLNFVKYATSASTDSGIAFQVSFNNGTEDKVDEYIIPVAKTSIDFNYKYAEDENVGFVTGTPYTDIDLNVADFRAYLLVGEEGSQVRTPITLTADMLSLPKTDAPNNVVNGETAVTVTYMGLSETVNVQAIDPTYVTDVTYSNMVITLAEDFSIAKQHYNSSIENLLERAVVSVKAVKTEKDGKPVTVDVTDLVELSYVTTEATTTAGTAYAGDGLDTTELSDLYIQAELDYGAQTNLYASEKVKVENPTVDAVVITPEYASDAVIGATVEWTIKVTSKDGWIFDNAVDTEADINDAFDSIEYYQNNGEASELPTEIDTQAINNIVLKIDGVESKQGVNLPAGKGYVAVDLSKLKAAQAEGYKPYITESISTRTADYSLVLGDDEKLGTEEGVTVTGTVSDADMPKITKIVPKVTNWAITDTASENTVDVYVTYRGENGVTTEKLSTQVEVTGQAWVDGTIAMTINSTALSTDSSKPTYISASSVTFASNADITAADGSTINGKPNYTYEVEGDEFTEDTDGEGDDAVVIGYTYTAADGDGTATITVTYPVKNGTREAKFYITAVELAEGA